jgi:predicted outer membrane repeat protein
MLNEVGIYGGFDPSVGDVGWGDRDWVSNETILSGDIGTPGHELDNCFHVFYHPADCALDNTAILDGFTITGGYADRRIGPGIGGGMVNIQSSPTVANCVFQGNAADSGGGAIYSEDSSLVLTNCSFVGNTAGVGGAAPWPEGGAI